MAVKLRLVPNPTFHAAVELTLHGGEAAPVDFTFKHRTKDQLDEWLKGEKDDPTAIMEMAEGWGLEEPFTRENAVLLEQNYQGAPLAILKKYIAELRQAKLGN